MEKALAIVLMAILCIVGIICGVVFTPGAECPKEKICEVCEVCEPSVCEETKCEVIICDPDSKQLLDNAVTEVLAYLDDEDLLICDSVEYDEDEVTVKKVYDSFNVEYIDDDEYEVTGSIKLNFKQDDETRCRNTIDFTVLYEEDEDPEVILA